MLRGITKYLIGAILSIRQFPQLLSVPIFFTSHFKFYIFIRIVEEPVILGKGTLLLEEGITISGINPQDRSPDLYVLSTGEEGEAIFSVLPRPNPLWKY